jgi:diguanylate cyclase (GGDEF)-like protein
VQLARQAVASVRSATARHLHRRIVAVFLGLLLLVQAASFLAIRHGIEANARRDIAGGMQTGEALLRRLLAQNAQQLRETARLLAADYGFRGAVAVGDAATLTDALANQADRIGADVAVFTDPKGRPIASTMTSAQPVLAMLAADAHADAALRGDTGLQVLDGRAYQMVTVPVKAPQLIGQVAMGFPLAAALPKDLHDLSSLGVIFLARPPGGAWQPLRVGDAAAPGPALLKTIAEGATAESAELDGDSTALHLVPLAKNDQREIAALLTRSIDAAVAPYRQLQIVLLAITLGGLLVFAIGTFFTARRITRPINALAESAERLAAGDYASPVPSAGSDEVGHLSRSFEAMRVGIRERDAEIRRLAYWDSLTGLPNREQFRELVRERLVQARRGGDPCAVLMLDVDRFKHVNDVLGHAFGDRLLGAIAARLQAGVLREHETLARLGGDKFVVCLPRSGVDAAVDVAQRLRDALRQPITLDDHTVDVSAGVGIAAFPVHATSVDLLLGRAELAMYAAKARQSGVTVYDAALDSSSEASLSLLSELRTAIANDELRLFLQPKLALASGDACGAEALVRWQHPRRGLLGPAEFIPFAEQTGFIREITGWMVERSAMQCSRLRESGLDLKIAVNLSTKDLMDLRLADKLERTLAKSGIAASSLGLEITESAMMDDPKRSLATLQRLDAMGHSLSIDDFGTGYSSLAYLKTLPLHELKIDRSFVMGMETDRADLKIVRSTIDLAHNLGYTVVAEGVETSQTWAILRALKCDEAQGYFMAKPMFEDDFSAWLDQWARPQARLRTEFAELM